MIGGLATALGVPWGVQGFYEAGQHYMYSSKLKLKSYNRE